MALAVLEFTACSSASPNGPAICFFSSPTGPCPGEAGHLGGLGEFGSVVDLGRQVARRDDDLELPLQPFGREFRHLHHITSISVWCGRRDLNPHALRHENLNLACLPIPPRPPDCRPSRARAFESCRRAESRAS